MIIQCEGVSFIKETTNEVIDGIDYFLSIYYQRNLRNYNIGDSDINQMLKVLNL